VRATAKRLAVDWSRCDGHALCARLLPEVIVTDEWGFPVLAQRPLQPEEVTGARRAVQACPALALRLESVAADAEWDEGPAG